MPTSKPSSRSRRASGTASDPGQGWCGVLWNECRDLDAFATMLVARAALAPFVRKDVECAFAEGLVHVDDPDDTDVTSYFRRVQQGWRTTARKSGIAGMSILPTTVDDLVMYVEDHERDPRDQQTRMDFLKDRIREGALAISRPPGRNQPCWRDSGHKYKKCCGSPANR